MTNLSRTIAQSADDAFQGGATMDLAANNLNANSATQYIILRFQNITIPPGSTINSATLDLNMSSASFDDPDLTIYGDDTDNAATPTTTNNDISGRTPTTATVTWTTTNIGTGYKTSPELKTILQEIINRGGWASGNAVAMILKGNSSSSAFRIKSYDATGNDYSILNVDYTAPGGGSSQPRRTMHQFRMRAAL